MQDFKQALTFNFSNAAVAMVDASALSLEVMANILSGYGFRRMFRCNDLESGTEVVKTQAIDLLLIDPMSFGQEGYNLINFIRSDKRGINNATPIIIVTAHTPVSEITAMRQCGADYMVAKPFSTNCLLSRILWVASSEGRRGDLVGPAALVTSSGSGMEVW